MMPHAIDAEGPQLSRRTSDVLVVAEPGGALVFGDRSPTEADAIYQAVQQDREADHLARLPHRRYSCVMRPLRYSINVTLDGCCDHRAGFADEDLHRHAVENLNQADALLFGRVTYEMMEAAWRPPARSGARPDGMDPFARKSDA